MNLLTCNNGKYTVTYISDDLYIGKLISRGYEWDGWMRNYISKYYKQGTDILDIGGNIGYNALMFSDYGPVHTFEPLFYNIINKNVSQNKLKNPVNVHPYGLSSKQESLKIFYPKDTNYGHCSVHQDSGHSDKFDVINVEKLDDIYSGVPSLIKMDVEGHEKDVLEGANEIIKKYKPTLFIEIHDTEQQRMFPFLQNLGYTNAIPCPEKMFIVT